MGLGILPLIRHHNNGLDYSLCCIQLPQCSSRRRLCMSIYTINHDKSYDDVTWPLAGVVAATWRHWAAVRGSTGGAKEDPLKNSSCDDVSAARTLDTMTEVRMATSLQKGHYINYINM